PPHRPACTAQARRRGHSAADGGCGGAAHPGRGRESRPDPRPPEVDGMRFQPPRPRSDEERILPLINIVFLLLIFFMVAGKFAATDPLEIDPPQSALESEAGPRELLVLLDAEGRLALDGEVMVESELKSALLERLA